MRRHWLLAAAIAGAALPTIPALAGHGGTATASPRDVLAGVTQQAFDITVMHEPPAGEDPADTVVVRAPGQLLTPTAGTAPGWMAVVAGDEVWFSGGGIPGGGAATFRVTADVARPPTDTCASWSVEVSSDGGATTQPASGTPAVCVRVLEVVDLDVVAPAGATDGTVTRGQTVCIRMRIVSHGGGEVEAVPSLSGAGAQVEPPTSEGTCSGDGAFTIVPGATLDVSWRVTFDASGSRTLTGAAGVAGSGESPGPGRSLAVVVQDPVMLTTGPGALSPRAIVGGPVTFTVFVSKGPSQSPGATFAPSDLELRVADCVARPTDDVRLAEGTVQVSVTFQACDVSATEGTYEATLTMSGADDNGASVTGSLGIGVVDVDRTLPMASVEIVPPPSRVPGQPPALSSGRPFQVRVELSDFDPASGQDVPCGSFPAPRWCRIVGLRLVPLTGTGFPTGPEIPITAQPTLTPGLYVAGVTTTFPSGTVAVRPILDLEDWVGFVATATGTAAEVDDQPPSIARASVVEAPDGSRRRIEVTFTEAICDPNPAGMLDMAPTDWTPMPIAVEGGRCPGRTVSLVYPLDVPEDLIGSISYSPGPQRVRILDRVGATLADTTVPLSQG